MNHRHEQEKIWQSFGKDEAERYWNKRRHKKRSRWFASMLSKYSFESVYEVGVNCGRNLEYILRFSPDTLVGGIDINREALDFAQEQIPGAQLTHGSIYDLSAEPKYDVVFTSGLLLHIPPDAVSDVIQSLLNKANKYVMHMETQGQDRVLNGPQEFNPTEKVSRKLRCVHNYSRLYHHLGYKTYIRTISEYPESDAQHIIIVTKR